MVSSVANVLIFSEKYFFVVGSGFILFRVIFPADNIQLDKLFNLQI